MGLNSKLKQFFGIATKKSDKGDVILAPAVDNGKGGVKSLNFPTALKSLYDLWLADTMDSAQTLRNRKNRIKDLDFCYYNSAIFSSAIELYADETVQADSQSEVLKVFAKDKKVEKYIIDFFKKIGINQNILRDTANNLALYGDSFWVNSFDTKLGITEITPVDINTVESRIEFNAIDYKKKLKDRSVASMINKNTILKDLVDSFEEEDNLKITQFYKSYLFGFVMAGNMVLPPWAVTHFRRYSTKSEFYPFGKPVLINAIAPFRQLQSAKNLMTLARANNFPLRIFNVKTHEDMTEMDIWEAVNDAREKFNNIGESVSEKEKFAMKDEIWLAEDLISVDSIDPKLDLDDIADIELLEDNLVIATAIPKGYLITDSGSWGDSGTALLQQNKMFGRKVYTIQSSILEKLVNLVKLQFLITGEFDPDVEFEISMNFPVEEQNADKVDANSDSLSLANDVLDAIGEAMGLDRDEAMPVEIVKQVFSKLSFLSSTDIDNWIKAIEKERAKADIEESVKKKINEKVRTRLNDTVIRESYFAVKEERQMTNGVSGGRHFVSSGNVSDISDRHTRDLIQANNKKKGKGRQLFA